MSNYSADTVTELLRDRIRVLIKDKSFHDAMNVEDIAGEIGAISGDRTATTVFRWLREDRVPVKYYERIANYFGVTVNWLKTGKGPRTPTISVGDSPNVNRSGENPQQGWVETTNVNATLGNSDSTSPSPKPKEGGSEVEAPDVGYAKAFIPEWIEVRMFDQVVARVHMSQIVPGQVRRVQIENAIFQNTHVASPLTEEPPQGKTE